MIHFGNDEVPVCVVLMHRVTHIHRTNQGGCPRLVSIAAPQLLLFVMAEVGHVGRGFDIKGRVRRDHKKLSLGIRLPPAARQFRL